MDTDLVYKMMLAGGAKRYNTIGATCTEPFWGIIVRDDTTLISHWIDDKGVNVRVYSNIVGETLTSQDPALLCPHGGRNSEFVLASGEVWLLK
jgi:uncharacterized membrane protein